MEFIVATKAGSIMGPIISLFGYIMLEGVSIKKVVLGFSILVFVLSFLQLLRNYFCFR